MSVEKGFIKFPVYRNDTTPYTLEMYYKSAGAEFKTDIDTTFTDVIMEVRTGRNTNSTLVKSLSLVDGEITVSDTNVLNFNLEMDAEGGTYFYDIKFQQVGSTEFQTYIKGVVEVEDNISRA